MLLEATGTPTGGSRGFLAGRGFSRKGQLFAQAGTAVHPGILVVIGCRLSRSASARTRDATRRLKHSPAKRWRVATASNSKRKGFGFRFASNPFPEAMKPWALGPKAPVPYTFGIELRPTGFEGSKVITSLGFRLRELRPAEFANPQPVLLSCIARCAVFT